MAQIWASFGRLLQAGIFTRSWQQPLLVRRRRRRRRTVWRVFIADRPAPCRREYITHCRRRATKISFDAATRPREREDAGGRADWSGAMWRHMPASPTGRSSRLQLDSPWTSTLMIQESMDSLTVSPRLSSGLRTHPVAATALPTRVKPLPTQRQCLISTTCEHGNSVVPLLS